MRPRRTPQTDCVFRLPGGTEDNDLWVRRGSTDGMPWLESVWELDPDECAAIAAGATVELRVWGEGTPPVSLAIGPPLEERRRRRRASKRWRPVECAGGGRYTYAVAELTLLPSEAA